MRNKIRLCIGWFGVLTPVYAAGALTVMLVFGVDTVFMGQVVVVSIVNFLVGRKLLKFKPILLKVVKENGKKKVKRVKDNAK